MPSMGGSGRSGGDDVGGMGNNASGGGTGSGGIGGITGGSNSSENISDVTKAMLHSPTTMEYVDRALANYAATPVSQRTGFMEDLSRFGSRIGTGLYNGFLGLVDTPINFVNRFTGVNAPTFTSKYGISTKHAPLTKQDPTPYEQYRGYSDFGATPPTDVTKSILAQDKALNPEAYGFMDSLMGPVAAMTSRAVKSAVNPLAALAMIETGVPLDVVANPFTQKTSGFLTGSILPDIEAEALAAYAADKLGVYRGETGYGPVTQLGGSEETRTTPTNNIGQAVASRGQKYGNYGQGYMNYGNYRG